APTFASTKGPKEAAPSKKPEIVPLFLGNHFRVVSRAGLYNKPFPAPAKKPIDRYKNKILLAKAPKNHPRPKTIPPINISFLGLVLSMTLPEIIPNNAMKNR